jgi:hypothetical protein
MIQGLYAFCERSRAMEVFHRMAYLAAANLMGASASKRITNEQLAEQLEEMALSDPDLAEHYASMAAGLPALQAQRAAEDAEMESAPRTSQTDVPRAA